MIREKISLSIHEMTVVAMMVAMIAILGAVPGIPLGFIPVPIVLQNMGIMIAGELLGPKLGTIAVWLFLFLVVLGLPLLSGGRGGMVTILGPTGGYIFAWLFVPLLIGLSLKLSWYYGMTQGKKLGTRASRKLSIFSVLGIQRRNENGKRVSLIKAFQMLGGLGMFLGVFLVFLLVVSVAAILM